jgi:SAM-dependent methyltransferase
MPSHLPAFSIHPADLQRRRQRCRPVVERLLAYPRTQATRCNVCDSPKYAVLCTGDRYGFPARTVMCLHCGLIYVADRFTPKGYSDFYNDGCYREMISCFKGRKQTIQRIDKAQVAYAAGLIAAMRGYVASDAGARLLDIGGSTGYVASEFQRHFGVRATLLEPASEEVAAARKLGIDAHVGSLEDFQSAERFDVILLCRTIEHLHDLRLSLTRIRDLLKPGGIFYCDIAEFMEICRREGPPEAITKIDHTYWLTQETAPGIFAAVGLEVAAAHLTLPPDQLGFLLRRSDPVPAPPLPPQVLHPLLRTFREVATDWQRFGSEAEGAVDWLRQRAYRIKKRIST